jgi:hypothetical protein
MLPEHKPVRRGREMIDLIAVEESKPKPALGVGFGRRSFLYDVARKLQRSAQWL